MAAGSDFYCCGPLIFARQKLVCCCGMFGHVLLEVRAHSKPLFKKLEILKFTDSITVNNCLFVYDYFHNNLPGSFTNTFFRTNDLYNYSTRQATTGQLYASRYKTTTFGLKCIYNRCIDSWKKLFSEINSF